jgi:hypothetical protein
MSGIIPPSIITYNLPFHLYGDKYVSVAFPFRVRIENIWFSANQDLFNGVDGDWFDAERTLKLAAWKSRNTKIQMNPYDMPSDMTNFFGSDPEKPYLIVPDESLKPTMYLGNQDDRPEGQAAQVTALNSGLLAFRSTAKGAPEIDDPANVGWGNTSWDETEWAQNTYKTDLSIMNTDEILSVFVYNSGGNWDNYENGSANITIHIAYTGMWSPDTQSAPTPAWDAWWND